MQFRYMFSVCVLFVCISCKELSDSHKYFGSARCSLISSHAAISEFESNYGGESAMTAIRAEFYSGSSVASLKACELLKSNQDFAPNFYMRNSNTGTEVHWENSCKCE